MPLHKFTHTRQNPVDHESCVCLRDRHQCVESHKFGMDMHLHARFLGGFSLLPLFPEERCTIPLPMRIETTSGRWPSTAQCLIGGLTWWTMTTTKPPITVGRKGVRTRLESAWEKDGVW